MIRAATLDDAPAMLAIYSPYISDSVITFETAVPSLEEFRTRVRDVQAKFPWIVFEKDGAVVGYAYATAWKTRAAYNWSVESSVYVGSKFHGQGIGRALYASLLEKLRAQGVVNVIGGVTLPNAASAGLHEAFGFSFVGKFTGVGFKFGKWWDVGYWELAMDRAGAPGELKGWR